MTMTSMKKGDISPCRLNQDFSIELPNTWECEISKHSKLSEPTYFRNATEHIYTMNRDIKGKKKIKRTYCGKL